MALIKRQQLHYQYQDVKVLYVEDERLSREKLLRVLGRRFPKVHVAMDGKEGFQLYQKIKADLIITDIKMKQMNGLEMIGKIRELDEKVQIIVTTAHDDHEYFIQSIETHVNHFIMKPIDLDCFLTAVQKSIYQIQLEKELVNQKMLTRAILDLQEHLIFVIENDEIVEFNRSFTSFTGIDKNMAYPKSRWISHYFVEDPHYFYPKDTGHWVEEFLTQGHHAAKVKWKSKMGKTSILYLKAAPIPSSNQFFFVCTDITDLESECKKNELLAMMDPLTNCYNRLKFDELLENEIRRAERYNHPFSLILMDIDHFKKVNDKFGHQVGDEVLVIMSTIVQQRIGECDIFARWGGEEFIILIPETDAKTAKLLADSIRSLMERYAFPNVGQVTCSFGVSEFIMGMSKRELVLEADQALYQSKIKGRNCVTVHP